MGIKEKLALSKETRIGTTSSDPYLGSPTFDEVPFHIHVGHRPGLGTYVIIDHESETNIVHYGRIISGTEDNERARPLSLQQNQAYQVGQKNPRPGDMAPHVMRVMTAEVLGEIHLNENGNMTIKEPKTLAQTGKGVYELPADRVPQLLNTPDSPDKGFHIGLIESGKHSVEFVLPMEAIARHLAVVGKTGVGKSYATGVLIEELVRHGIPIIAFDVLGDVFNATEDLNGRNFRAGENFRVPYSIIGLSEFLGFLPNLTSNHSEFVSMAYDVVFDTALKSLDEKGEVNIPIEQLLNEIKRVATEFGQADVGTRAARRVSAALNRNRVLTVANEEWLEDFAQKPISRYA